MKASFSKQEVPIDGVSLGMYRVPRIDILSHMYKKTCTFLQIKTSYTAIGPSGVRALPF